MAVNEFGAGAAVMFHGRDRVTPSAADYQRIFDLERTREYWPVQTYEYAAGFSLDRDRLEDAARVLACPLKANAPNWQHGRVIYAAYRKRLGGLELEAPAHCLDIGTAKGFSALVARWALNDSGRRGRVTSCDVIDPAARVSRNTVAEVDGLKTLAEILAPWPDAGRIAFLRATGLEAIGESSDRIACAFVDGKHSADVVAAEWRALAKRQYRGDVAIFDDCQIPAVRHGLAGADAAYTFERVDLGIVNRAYAVGIRQ